MKWLICTFSSLGEHLWFFLFSYEVLSLCFLAHEAMCAGGEKLSIGVMNRQHIEHVGWPGVV